MTIWDKLFWGGIAITSASVISMVILVDKCQ